MKYALLFFAGATACGSRVPAVPAAPTPLHAADQACAVPLPLLAKQHTPNVTKLYLASLAVEGGAVKIGRPALLTSKQGYVNQPAFSADGQGLYFTWRPEGGQADIYLHDLRTGAERAITCSSVEEYAAAPTSEGLAVVRVEANLDRHVVRLGPDGRERQILFPSLTSVGGQLWLDATTAVLFIAGESSSLVLADTRTGKLETLVANVGAATAKIPGTRDVSYVNQGDSASDGHWNLMRLDVNTRATALVLPLPPAVDQVAWLPDGSVLAGAGTRIIRASARAPTWQDVVDLAGAIDGTLARVVISGDRTHVAFVVRAAQG